MFRQNTQTCRDNALLPSPQTQPRWDTLSYRASVRRSFAGALNGSIRHDPAFYTRFELCSAYDLRTRMLVRSDGGLDRLSCSLHCWKSRPLLGSGCMVAHLRIGTLQCASVSESTSNMHSQTNGHVSERTSAPPQLGHAAASLVANAAQFHTPLSSFVGFRPSWRSGMDRSSNLIIWLHDLRALEEACSRQARCAHCCLDPLTANDGHGTPYFDHGLD